MAPPLPTYPISPNSIPHFLQHLFSSLLTLSPSSLLTYLVLVPRISPVISLRVLKVSISSFSLDHFAFFFCFFLLVLLAYEGIGWIFYLHLSHSIHPSIDGPCIAILLFTTLFFFISIAKSKTILRIRFLSVHMFDRHF